MQPELQAIQKKYKGKTDQVSVMRMQAETKAVYSKYGTSMTGSCGTMLIQLPILFALYQVIYRIPAYVPSVYKVFQTAAEAVMGQNGFIEVMNGIGPKIVPQLAEGATVNNVIDFLYKFTPAQWGSLEEAFPAIAQTLATVSADIEKMNYFLGVNLATAPFQGWIPNPAWLIPVLAALVQWYSVKLMTATQSTANTANDDNPMAQQMKSMNTMMPLMSLFFCFTLPAGIGVYWVASGICRMIQQIIINSQLSKMDVDEIVRANVEKANEKAIKEGKNPQELKSKTDRLLRDVRRTEQKAENEEAALKTKMEMNAKHVQDSTAYYNRNAKPGSLAAKANMVAMYDERQMEKKRNKNKKSGAEPAVSEVSSTAETADVLTAEDSQENRNE
jgi:YidC/Oxa1 family membrane protein insertase